MRENTLKKIWADNRIALNAWLTIPSAWTGEVMAHTGFDALTIDMQHGLMDYQTALTMLQAMSSTSAVPLVRVPWNDPVSIMRLLDAGAYGIVCPMINNRQEAEDFIQSCRYPPLGQRSYGPIRANVYAGNDYFSVANQTVLALAMIETSQALDNLEEIASTPGLDGLYVGTVDLSISLGLPAKVDFSLAIVEDALKKIVKVAQEYGLVPGIHVGLPENIPLLTEWGFQILTLTNDTPLLRGAASHILRQTRQKLGYV
ncbi:MAG: aldolase/citrate lyase family protein [Cyanobacteria bacterium P01_D01_bin.156]